MAKERIKNRTSELYKRAGRTPPKEPQAIHNMSTDDVQKLIHDLNVHQVELEIQNEELHRVQLQLEETRDKYLDLYNLAPIGYFTLDQASRILEANLIGAELLGIKQSELVRTRFTSYLSSDSQDTFYLHYKEVLNTGVKNSCELKILKADGTFFYAQLLTMAVPEKNRNIQHCKIAVIDLTESRRAEVQLRQSETKYSTLVEKGNDGIVIIQDGLISFANSKMTNITGTPPAESIGLPFVDFVSPKYQTFVADNYRKRIKGENAAGRYEIEILTKEGTCIPVEICASAIEYEGKPADMVVIRDITERKRTEEALKASEEKYSTLIEQSSDGVVILKGSLIEFGNRRIYDLSGYSQEELISKHFDELISSKSNELLLERKHTRLAGESVPDTYELEILTKDQQKIPVETKIQHIVYQGTSATMVIIRDMTESKRAEMLVRESERNLKTYLDNAPDGIYLSDLKGVFLYGNKKAEEILGYKKEDLIGNNFLKLNLLPAKYLVKAGRLLALNAMGKNTGPDEFELIRKDKNHLWLEINTAPLIQNDKKVVIGFVRDITERKQIETKLQRSEQNFRNSMDNSMMGIRVTDVNDKTLYLNQAFIDIFGYANIAEVEMNPPLKHYTPESYADYLHRKEKLMSGEPRMAKVELDIVRKDGIKRRLQLTTGELYWDGKQQYQTIYNDITDRKNAELALQASEENFRNSFESSLMGIRIVDADWNTLYVNEVFREIFGFKNIDEIGRMSIRNHYTPEESKRYLLREEKRRRGESVPENPVVEIVGKDGIIRYIQVFLKEVFWDGKQQRQLIYHDVTERQKAEESLQASEQNFRNSMDSSSMGIRIIGDHDDTLYANQALLEMFGYDNLAELKSSPPQEHYTPKSRTGFIQRHEQFLRGESLPDQLEFDIIRKGGAIRHLQLFSKNVIWNGKLQHQFIYNDITERKKAEQALKVSEMNFRNSLDSSLIGIRISDKEDQTSYINQAMLDIFGYESIEEVRTNPPWKHYTPESYASFVLRHEKFLLGEPMPDHVEIDVMRKDSAIRHLDVSMKEIFWDGKQQFQTLYNDFTERKQAEEALQESEEKYRLIVENSRDMIFTIDANEQYAYVSPSVTNILGYNPTNLIGKSFLSLVHPEDRHIIEEETRLSYLPGYNNSTDNEYRIRDASGEWRWVLTRGTRVIDNNGKFVYFLGISRDITERQKAEQELHESEEKYRLIVENSRDVIFTFNTAGEFTYISPSVSKELGYQPAELIGKPIWSFIHPEEASIIKNAVRLNIANGPLNRDGIEYRFRDASGEWHWYLGKGSTAYDANGNFINFTGIGRDITENKQSEDKLKQAAREWRTTFDSISDLISIHDKNNRIVRVNKTVADLLKTTPQELIGKSCREVMHGDQECPANCPHLLALKTGKPSSIEIFNSRLGLHLQESASPLFDEKGEITGTVLVARDVTQEKRMEEQLVMTDRLASIGELSSGIAHELNNPLTSVIGFSQLLMEGDVPDDIKEDLGIVHSEAQRAAAIVKNLLTFARKHAPVKELSNVNAVVEDVLRLRSYEQKVNNIEIENRLSPNLPEIMIDHFQMQQVFLNIMVNAEFAMMEAHHKGKLVVSTEKLAGTIRISFADDGPGISQENLKHIFDPFFTTKEVGKGTGLGLSICHGIVTEHGGQIYATSEKGHGATFVVELPVINEQ